MTWDWFKLSLEFLYATCIWDTCVVRYFHFQPWHIWVLNSGLKFQWEHLALQWFQGFSVVIKYKWQRGSKTVIKIMVAKSTWIINQIGFPVGLRPHWVNQCTKFSLYWLNTIEYKICFHLSRWYHCLYGWPNKKQEQFSKLDFFGALTGWVS